MPASSGDPCPIQSTLINVAATVEWKTSQWLVLSLPPCHEIFIFVDLHFIRLHLHSVRRSNVSPAYNCLSAAEPCLVLGPQHFTVRYNAFAIYSGGQTTLLPATDICQPLQLLSGPNLRSFFGAVLTKCINRCYEVWRTYKLRRKMSESWVHGCFGLK